MTPGPGGSGKGLQQEGLRSGQENLLLYLSLLSNLVSDTPLLLPTLEALTSPGTATYWFKSKNLGVHVLAP